MKIEILASVTYSRYPRQRKYKWKYGDAVSIYPAIEKKCVLRISTGQFGKKISDLNRKDRQVAVTFTKKSNTWQLELRRVNKRSINLTPYTMNPKHIWLQVCLNRTATKEFMNFMYNQVDKYGSTTMPVKVMLDLNEWEDVHLQPSDFLYHTETHAKSLLTYSLDSGFTAKYIPKGRAYDVELISPSGARLAIAISSHNAKCDSRSKQHRVNKALLDIAKMMPTLHEENEIIPVILAQPFRFKNSWNFVSNNYLQFYEHVHGFKFIFTDFEKGWEGKVCNKLLEIGNKQTFKNIVFGGVNNAST